MAGNSAGHSAGHSAGTGTGTKVVSLDEIEAYLEKKKGGDIGDPNTNAQRPKIFYGTGIPAIDFCLGGGTGEMGGLPAGHITEVYGMEAVGKTSLLYRMIAHAQRQHPDKVHLIFDYEHTTDKNYIQACGVIFDKQRLRIFRPRTLEEGIELLVLFHRTGRLGITVYDSLASMMPARDLKKREESLEDNQRVASKASVMSDMLKYLVPELGGTETAVAFINHEIANIVQNPYQGGYQPTTITPGGKALKYYASMRIQLLYKGQVNSEKKRDFYGDVYKGGIGKKIELHVEKFKFGNPHSRVRYDILAGEGIDMVTPLVKGGLDQKVVVKTGNTFTVKLPGFESVRVVGKDNFHAHVRENEPLRDALTAALGTVALTSHDEEPEDEDRMAALSSLEASFDD